MWSERGREPGQLRASAGKVSTDGGGRRTPACRMAAEKYTKKKKKEEEVGAMVPHVSDSGFGAQFRGDSASKHKDVLTGKEMWCRPLLAGE